MDKIRIRGGRPLHGEVAISGAKNAALPLMAACLLSEETLTLANLPHLADISTFVNLLGQHGVEISMQGAAAGGGHAGRVLSLNAAAVRNTTAPYDLVRKMRASVLVLGPLVARFGEAKVSLPGGCAIGTRPVDLHIKGLATLGAEIELAEGYIRARAPNGLTGGRIVFPLVSVGATENLVMAACLAKGETVLVNAAREPEIVDLVHCLRAMGADIVGEGSDTITVRGRETLHGAAHTVVPDRIETGTYALAAAATGGDLVLKGARLDHVRGAGRQADEAGAAVTATADGFRVACANGRLGGVDVMTEPYPGFPTDLQAQMMALMATAEGAAMITETIFENRFMHVPELNRMGANINVHGASAMVRGVARLDRRAGDGDRPARLGLAGAGRARRRGRDRGQPRLPSRSRLRADRGKAGGLRRRHRARRRVRRRWYDGLKAARDRRRGPGGPVRRAAGRRDPGRGDGLPARGVAASCWSPTASAGRIPSATRSTAASTSGSIAALVIDRVTARAHARHRPGKGRHHPGAARRHRVGGRDRADLRRRGGDPGGSGARPVPSRGRGEPYPTRWRPRHAVDDID